MNFYGISDYFISTCYVDVCRYRGFSVIIFAPLCAFFAVFLTNPDFVLPFYSNVFMGKMVGSIKLYFPIFLFGAIFGKVVEMSGFAHSIASTLFQLVGRKRAILVIVLLCAILLTVA